MNDRNEETQINAICKKTELPENEIKYNEHELTTQEIKNNENASQTCTSNEVIQQESTDREKSVTELINEDKEVSDQELKYVEILSSNQLCISYFQHHWDIDSDVILI